MTAKKIVTQKNHTPRTTKKRQAFNMRFALEDQKLLAELQTHFMTTEISSTIREAMIRAGEAVGIKITRVAEGVGYRVEG